MSKFYGQVEGMAKTVASRRGSDRSDIKASVQSWDGSIIMRMYYDKDDELCIDIEHASGSSFSGYTVFNDTVEKFLKRLR